MISVSKKETNIAGAYVLDLDNISDLDDDKGKVGKAVFRREKRILYFVFKKGSSLFYQKCSQYE